MAKGESITLSIEGLSALKAKLKEDDLYRDEWRAGFAKAASIAADAGRAAAPRGKTGDLAASVTSRMGASATLSASVSARAKHGSPGAKRKYAYGRLLEIAPKYGHVAWLLNAVRGAVGEISAVLEQTGARIAAKWAD